MVRELRRLTGNAVIATKDQLQQFLREHAEEIQRFGVERIGVFGSFARGEQTVDSDIDFMVVFAPGRKSFRNFMDLADYLEEHVGRRIEVLTPEALTERSRDRILAQVEYVPFAA